MRPEAEQLHHAARRYCDERDTHWRWEAQHIRDSGRSQPERDAALEHSCPWPRVGILEAIRIDLERLTDRDVGTLEDAREWFALAALTAASPYIGSEREAVVMHEEREAFARYVREVPATDLTRVEPMPYARVLRPEESERIWDEVERRWQLKRRDSFFPMWSARPPGVEAFQAAHFDAAVTAEVLGELLDERGARRVWELRETRVFGPDFERDPYPLEVSYTSGGEGYWTSATHDWLLFASHESSITVGGWLLPAVKRAWPEWERYIWTDAFYAR
jgi:hypothetical protein